MHKAKGTLSCAISIFLILLFFTGLSDYIATKDAIDLFLLSVVLILIVFSIRNAFRYVKYSRDLRQNQVESRTEQQEENYYVPSSFYNHTQSPEIQTNDYDSMEGRQFEHFCADVLKRNNFLNVEVTQGSGDHGIDILAEKDGITYAIQCKCYSSNIGNSAVQQAHTGKSLYHKDIAVVFTNRHFTAQAKEEAEALGVKLWDRDKLNELIAHE